MGKFAAAKATSNDPESLRQALNYLIDLLDRGYSASKMVNGKLVEVTISPDKVLEYSVDGVKQIYYNETNEALVTSKYDVNEDGRVDQEDVNLIMTYILHGTGYLPRMDVNGDGNVNALDATLVAKATGTEDYYPTETRDGAWRSGFDATGFYVSEDEGVTKTYLHTW